MYSVNILRGGITLKEEEKKKVGRPPKYSKKMCELAYKLCLLGSSDKKMADIMEIDESTFYDWKNKHKDFSKAIKEGKEEADANVGKSLYDRARGYRIEEEKIFIVDGKVKKVKTFKEYPPDAASMIFWLKNRHPENWRDKTESEIKVKNKIEDVIEED
jgi:hypothetical protein